MVVEFPAGGKSGEGVLLSFSYSIKTPFASGEQDFVEDAEGVTNSIHEMGEIRRAVSYFTQEGDTYHFTLGNYLMVGLRKKLRKPLVLLKRKPS